MSESFENKSTPSIKTQVKPQSGLKNITPYKAGRPIEEVQRLYGLKDVIKLASNENPFGPSPKALEAIQKVLTGINFYPDAASYNLVQGIAQHMGVSPDMVAVGNGADGLIKQLCVAFIEDGDEVIVSRSSFPVYDIDANAMRGKLIKVPTKNHGLDLEAMAKAITPRTKLIFVCNPNNPTGTYLSQVEIDTFMSKVPDHVMIILDEAYHEFVTARDYPKSINYVLEGRSNVTILRTFSKVYGLAGIRLGYGIAIPDIITIINTVKESFAVNILSQAAGISALGDKEFLDYTVKMNNQGKDYLYKEFKRLGLNYVPSQTNFILVEFGPNAAEISQKLLENGVIVRPGEGYDLPTFARVSIGTPEQNERFIKTLEKLIK